MWQVAGKRLFVTIYRRKDTLVIRALNPAAQRETELVLPVQQLPRLLPAELLSEERETDMLKHIANQCVAVGPCVVRAVPFQSYCTTHCIPIPTARSADGVQCKDASHLKPQLDPGRSPASAAVG